MKNKILPVSWWIVDMPMVMGNSLLNVNNYTTDGKFMLFSLDFRNKERDKFNKNNLNVIRLTSKLLPVMKGPDFVKECLEKSIRTGSIRNISEGRVDDLESSLLVIDSVYISYEIIKGQCDIIVDEKFEKFLSDYLEISFSNTYTPTKSTKIVSDLFSGLQDEK